VENATGVVKADATRTFKRFGLGEVPTNSHGIFILEEEPLSNKI
jgi:hypothetical protein